MNGKTRAALNMFGTPFVGIVFVIVAVILLQKTKHTALAAVILTIALLVLINWLKVFVLLLGLRNYLSK
jgi:hypothetical protein